MSRFKFRLQPVLDVRARVQDERQRELALKQRELAQAQAQLESFDTDRETQRAALLRDHRAFDVDALRATYAHLAYLDRAIEEQRLRLRACQAEALNAQQKLVAANTDKKILETLRTRRLDAFSADAALSEQREADDQNARRYGRTKNERGA